LGLPDVGARLEEARAEAEAARTEAKGLATELETARKELTEARRKQEDVLRTAEEELEKLSATEVEERKGFLGGLFRKKSSSESSARLRAVTSKLKLRAAGSAAGGEEDEIEEAEEAEEVEVAEELVGDSEGPANVEPA